MSSAMISQTLQGAVLSITSNILAQAISSYQDSTPFSLNLTPVLKFAFFSILSNPPNIVWQNYLEDLFPTSIPLALPPVSSSEKHAPKPTVPSKTRTSKTNIFIKFLLDQTFGAVVNTVMLLAYMGYLNASTSPDVWGHVAKECRDKTWPMMKDGYKFWPLVSLISFSWVPVDKRVVFGCAVGVIWGIYLSLMVGA